MGENNLRSKVEQVVGEVVGGHVKALCSEVVDRVCAQLATAQPAAEADGPSSISALAASIRALQEHTSQAEILSSLLEGCGKFSTRTALFVLRSGNPAGWRARGFGNNDAVKSLVLDGGEGLAARVIQGRAPVLTAANEFDAAFLEAMGHPAEGANIALVPLIVREKVAALVYADPGSAPQGKLETPALDVLVRSASWWLEVVAARKAGTPAEVSPTLGTQVMSASASAAAAPASEPEPEPAPEPALQAAAAVVEESVPEVEAEPEPASSAALSADDQAVHQKARRFAKLLVDEIKLYNKKKVEQGKATRDLYQRLKDDIDKSRATYEKRFGQTAAASADYFTSELVRSLADGDKALLGSGFSG